MNEELRRQASKLAKQPYMIQVFLDETSSGKLTYVANSPELGGCTAHGKTVEKAKSKLKEVMVSYIYYLLEDGLEVPAPVPIQNGVRLGLYLGCP